MLNVIYQIASNNYYNMFFILIYLYLFAQMLRKSVRVVGW